QGRGQREAWEAAVVAAVVEVGSAWQFEELLRLRAKSFLVVHFWCAQMNDVMAELAKELPQVSFVKLEPPGKPFIEVQLTYKIFKTVIVVKGSPSS
uniref:Uncharacterized protein n=1 Tax=Capra hircus TaxID=9925 RepID=A0A452FQW7_CAPHI